MREIKFRAWRLNRERSTGESVHPFMEYEVEKSLCRLSEQENLMQFIGEKDKNGKEIYEGDILHGGSPGGLIRYVVKWKDSGFVFEPINPSFDKDLADRYGIREVIGNIHQNPDLLK